MTAPIDPIKSLRKRLAVTRAVGALAITVTAGWTFMLPTHVDLPQIDIAAVLDAAADESEPGQAHSGVRFEPEDFNVRLWNPPVPPSPAPEIAGGDARAPDPPPPLRLIGIISDGDILRAALYDLEQDRLLIVQHGESVRDYIVQRIDHARVVLQQGDRSHELRLKDDQS